MQQSLHADTPRYRSGAAARMAKMPAATLRIWERRYQAINPGKAPSGQRLYSDSDVHRLTMLKTLSERGHAIGTIAALSSQVLEELLPKTTRMGGKFASALAIGGGWKPSPAAARWTFRDDIASASNRDAQKTFDLILVRLPSLHFEAARELLALADRKRVSVVGVAYTFAVQSALDMLRLAGVAVCRESGRMLKTEDFTQLLDASLEKGPIDTAPERRWERVSRQYSEDQLEQVASLSSAIACECPRHLADLIRTISAFEVYSDECAVQSSREAALHRHLGDVANRARTLFESALQRLAREENLALGGPRKLASRGRKP